MIRKELIFIDSDVKNREETLDLLIRQADQLHLLKDKEQFKTDVKKREETMPTSIGFQVAIPHGKSSSVIDPFVAFLKAKEPFLWDERNDNLVDLIFLIGVPEEKAGNLHLMVLSEISKKLIDDAFRDELRMAHSNEEAYQKLNEINEKVRVNNL